MSIPDCYNEMNAKMNTDFAYTSTGSINVDLGRADSSSPTATHRIPSEDEIIYACINRYANTAVNYEEYLQNFILHWGNYGLQISISKIMDIFGRMSEIKDLFALSGKNQGYANDEINRSQGLLRQLNSISGLKPDHIVYDECALELKINTILAEEEPVIEKETIDTSHLLIEECYCDDTEPVFGNSISSRYTPGLARYFVQLLGTIDREKYTNPLNNHNNHCVWENLFKRQDVLKRL